MSKKRVIACLIVRNGMVVQSIGFTQYLPVGHPEIAARFLNAWGVDEIVLLDINATAECRAVDCEMIRRVAVSCHVPLAVGNVIALAFAFWPPLAAGHCVKLLATETRA